MAIDFLGNELHIGDDVVFSNYNGTSASLERGTITKLFEHQAEIGTKRRAEYKIVRLPTVDAVPVVRCRDCDHVRLLPASNEVFCDYLTKWHKKDDFCSYGERRIDSAAD